MYKHLGTRNLVGNLAYRNHRGLVTGTHGNFAEQAELVFAWVMESFMFLVLGILGCGYLHPFSGPSRIPEVELGR